MLTGPRAWLIFALILALNLVLTLTHLDADPPVPLAGGATPNEGLYVLNARNQVLEGQARPDEWDNRLLHPVGSSLTRLAFERWGVRLESARRVSVIVSALSLVLFFALLRRAARPGVALLASLFMATNPFFVTYSRQAGPVALSIFLMLATIFLWELGRTRRLWLLPAGICLVAASVMENGPQNSFFLVTAALAVLLVRMQAWKMPWAARTRTRRQIFTWTAIGTLAAWFLLFVLPHLPQFVKLSEVPLGVPRWGNVPQNLFMAPFTFWGYLRWTPLLCLVATTYFLVFARSLFAPIARHLPLSETRVWFFAWLVTAPFFLALQAERPLDFMVVMTPPLCMAAAEALVAFLSLRQVRKPRVDILVALGSLALASWFIVQGVVHSSVDRWYRSVPAWFFEHQFRYEFLVVFLVATPVTVLLAHLWLRWKRFTLDLSPTFVSWSFAALLLAVLWGGVAPVRWLLEPRYEVRDASRVIEALPPDAVVAGTWAPLLTLDSGRRGLVIWPRLNNVRPIETHGITHLLLQRGSSEDLPNNRVFASPAGGGMPAVELLRTLPLGDHRLDLYRADARR